jgi:hypothetical protein
MKTKMVPVLVLSCLVASVPARAHDPWETGTLAAGDDNPTGITTLSHGSIQQHDLQEAGTGIDDVDFVRVQPVLRHSYEARITDTNVIFGDPGIAASFTRRSPANLGLQNDASVSGPNTFDRTIRWIAFNTDFNYLRVVGHPGTAEDPSHVYTVRFWDTTYSIPRWNNNGSQVTVFLISNLTGSPVNGTIDFYSATGALLSNQNFTIPPNGLHSFNTSTVPALAGLSGHAYVAHNAGWGGLAGKAVALEPSTGFSFDTTMTPVLD